MNSMHRGATGLTAVVLLALACTPGPAQTRRSDPPAIRVGQTITANLVLGDPTANERGRFKVFRFDATQDQRYIVTMNSADFDAYLTVARTVGGIMDVLASDDDSGGNTDARLRFRAPASGSYLIVAQSLSREGTGDFTLKLESAPALANPQPVALQLGQTVQGRLEETSPILEDESRYHPYSFTGRAGQRLVLTMRAPEFDAYLRIGRMLSGQMEEMASNDDGAGGTDSRLRITLPADGTYLIQAGSLGGEALGEFTLTVEEPRAPAPATPQPLRAGEPVQGALKDTDLQLDDGSYYVDWTYTASAGERLRISMRSEAFDTFLAIGQLVGGEFQEIASNDDGLEGTDSLVEVTLPEAGTYIIRASSLMGDQTGAYTLQVEREQ